MKLQTITLSTGKIVKLTEGELVELNEHLNNLTNESGARLPNRLTAKKCSAYEAVVYLSRSKLGLLFQGDL